jgi:hypothetical protein
MVSCLGKCPLSCCLFGPIDIDQEPAISQTIPESAWRRAERGSGHKILLKEEPECFDAWLIKGSEKTTERAMTGKVVAAKERHEGGSKGPETLIKRFQCGFPTHSISDEDDDKVNGVVVTKSSAGKPHTLLDCIENAKLSEHMSKNGHFTKP